MRHTHLGDMVGGWFVGAFEPSALKTPAFEVGIKRYRAGDADPAHHHKIAEEITVVLSGHVVMCGRDWHEGDIVAVEPGESSRFTAVTDAILVVVKVPSVVDDKYLDP